MKKALKPLLCILLGVSVAFSAVMTFAQPAMSNPSLLWYDQTTMKWEPAQSEAVSTYPLVGFAGMFSGTFANPQLQLPCRWRGMMVNSAGQIILANVAAVATTLPLLSFEKTNGRLQTNRPGDHVGLRRQCQPNLAETNWLEVINAGTANLLFLNPTNRILFFRLVYS